MKRKRIAKKQRGTPKKGEKKHVSKKALPALKGPISLHLHLQKARIVRSGNKKIRRLKIRLSRKKVPKIKELSNGQARNFRKQSFVAIKNVMRELERIGKKPKKKKR
ncbi:hypothetical protein J4457_06965 [Candidatus Woesearchaeota archaeon]|nr:hypothetical protein [Candidatus Woesearchaeota archaeon]